MASPTASTESPSYSTRSLTRDTYAPDFEAVTKKIDEAVRKSLPAAQAEYYTKVLVLSMTWTNDDLGIEPLAHELLDVFKSHYGFSTKHYRIDANPPSKSVGFEFNKHVSTFINNHAAKNTLLIFVYSGHAVAHPTGFDTDWMGKNPSNHPSTPRIQWNILRDIANAAPGDHLFILDCCNASASALGNWDIRGNGNEFFVACGIEHTASGNIANSFTRRLIDLLKRHSAIPMSVTQLHSKLWSEAGLKTTWLENTPGKFGAGGSGDSIVLRPLEKKPYHLHSIQQTDASSLGKVLIKVSLKGRTTLPDEATFSKWLLTFLPSEVQHIKVEGIFDSDSTVLLATIPFSAWTALQDDDMFSYVAVVKTGNLMLSEAARDVRGLSVRPKPSGYENRPFAGSSKS